MQYRPEVNRTEVVGALALGAVLGGIALVNARRPKLDLPGKVVLITGGSRGLGYILARDLLRAGCRVAICGRDIGELEEARRSLLAELGPTHAALLAIPCDVADRDQVAALVDQTTRTFGRIDILINNAGIIQAAPIENMTVADFEQAHAVMFWGVLYPTLAVLPQMQARRSGNIVNVTSIGGIVSVPHLVPYSSAKFAAVGLSEGLRAELGSQGITVTTIAPGLMRTGSYLNATFKGQEEKEFAWFALGASLPVLSIDGERAARQIIHALVHGEAHRVLSLTSTVLAKFHGLFPGLTADLMGLAARWMLPAPGANEHMPIRGAVAREQLPRPQRAMLDGLTTMGRHAADRFQ